MNTDSKAAKFESTNISRRSLLTGAAAAAAFTIVPSRVLAGTGKITPNNKINLGCIGVGDQGTRDMKRFLTQKQVRVIAVCDVDTGNRKKAKSSVASQGKVHV